MCKCATMQKSIIGTFAHQLLFSLVSLISLVGLMNLISLHLWTHRLESPRYV